MWTAFQERCTALRELKWFYSKVTGKKELGTAHFQGEKIFCSRIVVHSGISATGSFFGPEPAFSQSKSQQSHSVDRPVPAVSRNR